jgi:F420H(2)-dependent quinone reductase
MSTPPPPNRRAERPATGARRVKTLYLLTTGRRTGKARRTPLYYVEDGPNLAIVTSNAGRDHEPAWWLNLQADPDAVVEIAKQPRTVRARRSTDAEQERLWPDFVAGLRNYASYQRKTRRKLIVVILEPR